MPHNTAPLQPLSTEKTPFPTIVYTGIYIHRLTVHMDSVSCVGYVWQKYPIDSMQTISPGIIFPQAYACDMEQAYQITQGSWQTTGWAFRCSLKQNFDFQDYPIDFQKIEIALWPKRLDNQIVLVPDLESYKTVNPSALPGVNRSIALQNWKIDRSYFSFLKETYATNFGYHSQGSYSIVGSPSKTRVPKLSFTVVVDRQATSLVFFSLLPLLIIFTLLFIVIVMTRKMHFYHMLASIASLFFTSQVSYSAFKTNLPTQKIIFFDYLYFILQITILTCGTLSILYYKKINISLVRYNHMFIPQVLFWPTITMATLLVSILFFQYY
jgi:hypothetical protein